MIETKKIKAVITGDIVNSTKVDVQYRYDLLETLNHTLDECRKLTNLRSEIFRGDSFQVILDNPSKAALIALIIRSGLKSLTPDEIKTTWDARISIGIGSVNFDSGNVVTSDGEAFRLSGRNLDIMGKRRLIVNTCWEYVNEELKVSTAFLDNLVTHWNKSRAGIMYFSLLYAPSISKMAEEKKTTFQNISKLLNKAGEDMVTLYLARFEELMGRTNE